MEKYAFRMRLHPGRPANTRRVTTRSGPEVGHALKDAVSPIIRSTSMRRTACSSASSGVRTITGWPICRRTRCDAEMVGPYGRYHGDPRRQRAGRRAAQNRLPSQMMMKTVAVIDIGKTNAKVALVDLERLRGNRRAQKPAMLVSADGLTRISTPSASGVSFSTVWPRLTASTRWMAISVTTHGATAVLLDEAGELALPVLDYGIRRSDALAEESRRRALLSRQTGSARLPMGLNVGAQPLLAAAHVSEHFARVATISPMRNIGPTG